MFILSLKLLLATFRKVHFSILLLGFFVVVLGVVPTISGFTSTNVKFVAIHCISFSLSSLVSPNKAYRVTFHRLCCFFIFETNSSVSVSFVFEVGRGFSCRFTFSDIHTGPPQIQRSSIPEHCSGLQTFFIAFHSWGRKRALLVSANPGPSNSRSI
uniref:Uncharacterized protein n=1 Tax=Ixodes ricinus TaxID=34613 RepID=A0A090X8B6_IXORI